MFAFFASTPQCLSPTVSVCSCFLTPASWRRFSAASVSIMVLAIFFAFLTASGVSLGSHRSENVESIACNCGEDGIDKYEAVLVLFAARSKIALISVTLFSLVLTVVAFIFESREDTLARRKLSLFSFLFVLDVISSNSGLTFLSRSSKASIETSVIVSVFLALASSSLILLTLKSILF